MPTDRGNRPPTMTDVAQLAGVSQTTVSLVLNNVSLAAIPPETRDRIREAVRVLGYRPNTLAQSLRTSRSQLVGFIADEIAATPFAGNLIKGAQEAAWAEDKILLAINTDGSAELEAAAIERLLQHRVDGIIYATSCHRSVSPPATIAQVPTILVNCYSEDRGLPSVVPNEVQGGAVATRAVLERGHRRLGYVAAADAIPARDGPLEGYVQALQAYGIPLGEESIVYRRSHARGGYEGAHELLDRSAGITGIFCSNDRMAMGAYDAIRERGLRIPEDVSVVGFDNQEIIAAHLRPPLSTVALPHYEMGRCAIDLLDRHSRSDDRGGVRHLIDCPFIERQSIAAPRRYEGTK